MMILVGGHHECVVSCLPILAYEQPLFLEFAYIEHTCTMEKKPDGGRQLHRLQTAMFERYCNTVLYHPWITIVTTLLISSSLVIISLCLHYDVFDFDPVKGFDTRGTSLANARLTLDAIKRISAGPAEMLRYKLHGTLIKRQAKTFKLSNDSSKQLVDVKIEEGTRSSPDWNLTTLEPLLINYDDYGTDTEPKAVDLIDPCVQYSALGTAIPFEYVDYSAKIIVEIDSAELYTLRMFRKLCDVDRVIDELIAATQRKPALTQLKNSFNLPHYSNCLRFSTSNTCNALNVHDIEILRSTIQKCRKDPRSTICNSMLMGQVLNYLLPRTTSSEMTYVAILLKITASSGGSHSLDFYDGILEGLQRHFAGDARLKGAFFNVKENEFLRALLNDSKLAAISAGLILLCFLLYSCSFLYTLIVFITMFLSMGVAFFFYTMVLHINFFPSLNTLAVVVMIAVGADDAFLLHAYYKKYKKGKDDVYEVGDPYVPLYKERDRVLQALRTSLRHSLASMFVTSATTAVAFISNLTSDIIVLRCFGVFAGLTVMANYLLIIFLLPSSMALTFSENQRRCCHEVDVASKFSHLLYQCRHIIVFLGAVATAVAFTIIFISPGFPLPNYNPVKLLTSTNPYEWFFNNGHMFNFEWKRKWKFMEYCIIGIESISDTKLFDPYQEYNIRNEDFIVSTTTLKQIQKIIDTFIADRGGHADYHSWLDRFLSSNISCIHTSRSSTIPPSCLLEYAVNTPPSSFPDDFASFPSDGPIFDKALHLIGYFVAVPSNITLSLNSVDVANVFRDIDANFRKITARNDPAPVMCLSSSEMTKYHDIIATLASSTLFSVAISVAISLVVVILCTRRLMLSIISVLVICGVILWTTSILILLGWQFSVVESTILVLTIGLGFDFTLHLAVSYRDDNARDPKIRISSCLSSAGQSCVLGAITSILCGIPLLFASTAAFTQVGSMLITLGLTSLCGAVVLFPAIILCLTNWRNKIQIIRL